MKKTHSALPLLSVALIITHILHVAPAAQAPAPALGINLNGPDDWNTEIPFVDAFRLSRHWISQRTGSDWGKGPTLDLDENGWIKSLEPGCFADTIILSTSGRLPEGVYTLLYEGTGVLQVRTADSGVIVDTLEDTPGRIIFNVSATSVNTDASIIISLKQTDPNDYVRNIRVLLPGHADNYMQEPFRPGFLKMWSGVKSIRFMDWQKTNNSKIKSWSQRPTLNSCRWTRQGGVPIEVMVDLSNRLKAHPWFCMPHLADDDYVRNFAQLVKEKLDPSLKVYIEYSNEVWNSMFEQHRWAGEQGISLGLADKPWEGAWRFYARRSMEIFKIWEEVFGGTDRLVRVLATQSANTHVGRQILRHEDAGKKADALAIAPYIGFNIPPRSDNPNTFTADQVANWSVDEVIDEMTNNRLPTTINQIRDHKELADQYGLLLIAYEGGQHAVGINGAENNQQLTDLLISVNRSPRMGTLYESYYKAWQENGGDLFMYFSSIGRWSKWGCWGIMEYYNSDPKDYAKFLSTMRWAKSLGQPVGDY
jgi:hypothetical protein